VEIKIEGSLIGPLLVTPLTQTIPVAGVDACWVKSCTFTLTTGVFIFDFLRVYDI
jgi:hypothetical protein